MLMNNLVVIIPALNPPESLIEYVKELQSEGFLKVVIVNDGSKNEFSSIFSELNSLQGCIVLNHNINMGKGRALKTAFTYITKTMPTIEGVITADADGQHTISDVCRVAKTLAANGNDLILGIRNFQEGNVPKRSYLGNTVTSYIFSLLFGRKLQDTQTGLRAIPKQELSRMLSLKGERYEYEINMLIYACKRNLRIQEVSIQTIYYNNNSGSYYNTIKDSMKIFRKLISGFLYFNRQYKNILSEPPKPVGEIHDK